MFWQVVAWGLIVVGVAHQFAMLVFGYDEIPFIQPPGNIKPFVSLEYQWWLVLLLAAAVMCIMAYSDRLKSIPTRLALPFYVYIVFLLIWVKPV
jgi:hypothetical protein